MMLILSARLSMPKGLEMLRKACQHLACHSWPAKQCCLTLGPPHILSRPIPANFCTIKTTGFISPFYLNNAILCCTCCIGLAEKLMHAASQASLSTVASTCCQTSLIVGAQGSTLESECLRLATLDGCILAIQALQPAITSEAELLRSASLVVSHACYAGACSILKILKMK